MAHQKVINVTRGQDLNPDQIVVQDQSVLSDVIALNAHLVTAAAAGNITAMLAAVTLAQTDTGLVSAHLALGKDLAVTINTDDSFTREEIKIALDRIGDKVIEPRTTDFTA